MMITLEAYNRIDLVGNGIKKIKKKFSSVKVPKEKLYYSFDFLFPDAIFFAAAPKMHISSKRFYKGVNENSETDEISFQLSEYYHDKKLLEAFDMKIWLALGVFFSIYFKYLIRVAIKYR